MGIIKKVINRFLQLIFKNNQNKDHHNLKRYEIEETLKEEEKEDIKTLESFLEFKPNQDDWIGEDFRCFIRRKGDVEFGDDFDILSKDFENALIIKSKDCKKEQREGWVFYKVGNDEYTFDFEPVGIMIYFNDNITYPKAKEILDEICLNIMEASKQEAEVVVECKHDHRITIF